MADFTWICRNLTGSSPSKGHGTGMASCSRGEKTGPHCTPGSPEEAKTGKETCPHADYLKILSPHKKK